MNQLLAILLDICVIFFDLYLFTRMVSLRQDGIRIRAVMYGGCAVIIVSYLAATYGLGYPSVLSSAVCMSLPSLALFFALSQYRDARFLLTFCFIDSCSLILAFWGRFIQILLGSTFGYAMALIFVFSLCLAVVLICTPYFRRYRELLSYAEAGWGAMTICAALIYFALVFFAAWPKPIIQRLEYVPTYLVFSLVVLSCYMVFISSVLKTSRIYEQKQQLLRERQWHEIAFVDALTGVANRTAYVEKINEMERTLAERLPVCLIVFDLDAFKQVNDTLGHSAGDRVLKHVAEAMNTVFSGDAYALFRLGGDEFVVIAQGVSEPVIEERIALLEKTTRESGICFSSGYAFVDAEDGNAMEHAFVRADACMYARKRTRKQATKGIINKPAGSE